jgi:polygalacturonase
MDLLTRLTALAALYVLLASCGGDGGAPLCSPLKFGAVGDGMTDNTSAIQNAVDTCAAQGGGTVALSVVGKNAVYVTGPFTLRSHVHLQIDQGVTLQATNEHSRYVAAYINWVYQPN